MIKNIEHLHKPKIWFNLLLLNFKIGFKFLSYLLFIIFFFQMNEASFFFVRERERKKRKIKIKPKFKFIISITLYHYFVISIRIIIIRLFIRMTRITSMMKTICSLLQK